MVDAFYGAGLTNTFTPFLLLLKSMESVNSIRMEKKKPHYDLDTIEAIVLDRGMDSFTETALRGLPAMGGVRPKDYRLCLACSGPCCSKA